MNEIAAVDADMDQPVRPLERRAGDSAGKAELIAEGRRRRARRAGAEHADRSAGDGRGGEPAVGRGPQLDGGAGIAAREPSRDVRDRRALEERHAVGRTLVFQARARARKRRRADGPASARNIAPRLRKAGRHSRRRCHRSRISACSRSRRIPFHRRRSVLGGNWCHPSDCGHGRNRRQECRCRTAAPKIPP